MSSLGAKVYWTGKAVTASDTVDDPAGPFAALYVTAAGTVAFITPTGDTVTLATSVTANTEIPINCKRVKSTGTTATVIGLLGVDYVGRATG
jgi:hypothetical protein